MGQRTDRDSQQNDGQQHERQVKVNERPARVVGVLLVKRHPHACQRAARNHGL